MTLIPPASEPGVDTYGGGTYDSGDYQGAPPLTEPYFITAEDDALHKLLNLQLTVSDNANRARLVPAYFGQPDPQKRGQLFPYLVLDLLNVGRDAPREQTRYGPLHYTPPGAALEDTNYAYSSDYYLEPMLLTYQVSSWARNPRHDRAIMTQLNHVQFHPHYAQITVPTDNTARRLVIANFTKRDTVDAEGKRVFRNIWTVQIPSEMFYAPLDLTQRVQTVTINSDAIINLPNGSEVVPPIYYPGAT